MSETRAKLARREVFVYHCIVQQVTKTNFGLLIAYLIPGFIALVGMGFLSDTVRAWLVGHDAVTLGGFLYSTIAALVIGLLCSTVRWIAIDTLHHKTGIHRPVWKFADLQENLEAYALLEENHYRYFQFYANSLVAWAIGYGSWRYSGTESLWLPADFAFAVIAMLLYLGSRDTLRKYYQGVLALLSSNSGSRIITQPFDITKDSAQRNTKRR